jgi:hypothetical protein
MDGVCHAIYEPNVYNQRTPEQGYILHNYVRVSRDFGIRHAPMPMMAGFQAYAKPMAKPEMRVMMD